MDSLVIKDFRIQSPFTPNFLLSCLKSRIFDVPQPKIFIRVESSYLVANSIDQAMLQEIAADANQAKQWGFAFLGSSLLMLVLFLFPLPIKGFSILIISTSIILGVTGILFLMGSTTTPKDRKGIVERLQKTMLDKNPNRRLWAAQRLVGYVKDSNFIKEDILELAYHARKVIKTDPEVNRLQKYIAVDHIILLREILVSVPMNKHVRKDFVEIIKPLRKLEWLPEDAVEILADAIAFHPSKLPVQAYLDYERENKDNSDDKNKE